MKIGILSRNETLYSTRRLVEAARKRGHEVKVVDVLKCYMNITANKPTVHYMRRGIKEKLEFDAVIPRLGSSVTQYGTAVLRQFEVGGVYSVNASLAITRSRDKLRAHQLLARKGVGMPITSYANSASATEDLIDFVGGPPLVVKVLEGTHGQGVVLAETRRTAESLISAFRGLKANFLVQEFIQESAGTDIRAFVVGGKVIGAMQRRGIEGEYRSNLHRGGSAAKIKLRPEERKLAIRAAKVMGLDVAGVDIIRSTRGPLVLEVNSSPGLRGIEAATEIDIADAIIDFIEKDMENRVDSMKGQG